MIKPLLNKVLVRMDFPKNTNKGGVIIPAEVTRRKSPTGIVMSIGSRVNPDDVTTGDKVILPAEGRGTPVLTAGAVCYILPWDDLLAVLR